MLLPFLFLMLFSRPVAAEVEESDDEEDDP